jgi:spore coat protein B
MNRDMMKSMVSKIIKIDRGGPESKIGKLLDVYDDHLVVLTEDDGVVYYCTHHIKSVTENAKEQIEFSIEVPENFEFKKAENFHGILSSLMYQWVKINRGGPEKLEGVLGEVTNDYVSIINKEEIVRLSMFHIRNISYGLKVEPEEEEAVEEQGRQENGKGQGKQKKGK